MNRSNPFPFLFSLVAVTALTSAGDTVDLDAVHRIKTEAFENSRVMDHLFYLTDVNGPRLTGSPGFQKAAEWAVARLKEWGAEGARTETWGPFGRSWTFSRFELQMLQPAYAALRGSPLAWCAGTAGPVRGGIVAAPWLRDDETLSALDIATIGDRIGEYRRQWKGKLHGKFVLIDPARDFNQSQEPASRRYDDKALASIIEESDLTPTQKPDWVPDRLPRNAKKRAAATRNLPLEIAVDNWTRRQAAVEKLYEFLKEEGALAVFLNDRRGEGGILFAEAAGRYQSGASVPPAAVKLTPEHFNRLIRLAEKDIPVELELNLDATIIEPAPTANVIGEILGAKKPDEVVMLGGHLDSWHSATGATDNAAGSAVALEAFRILKSLRLNLDRTVRIALWSGEEQGLHGSRAYVREHFADPMTMALKPEHPKFCGYFNLDNGSGRIRGVYLQGNDMMRPIFESWLAPFRDLGATTISIHDTGGTDHLSFDAVGLPAFQFIQDPLDYGTRTHHSELDVYDHVEPGDLMQASAIMASFVYNAANRETPLPRKPAPSPLPQRH